MSSDEHNNETAAVETRPEVALLREENQRLRDAYRRTKRVQYRRTAGGLALVGMLAVAGAGLWPSLGDTLLVLGAIGIFGGLLTVYLTPDRVLTATVSDAVYTTHANTGAAIIEELGLQADQLYVPPADTARAVRVFCPKHTDYRPPEKPTSLFLVDVDESARGAAVPATGNALYREFEQAAVVSETPSARETVAAVADAIVEQFELADSVEYDHEPGRVTVEVSGSEPPDISRFDHPIMSLFGVALARTEETTIERASVRSNPDRFTFTWATD